LERKEKREKERGESDDDDEERRRAKATTVECLLSSELVIPFFFDTPWREGAQRRLRR
jgi:hypothetical protein